MKNYSKQFKLICNLFVLIPILLFLSCQSNLGSFSEELSESPEEKSKNEIVLYPSKLKGYDNKGKLIGETTYTYTDDNKLHLVSIHSLEDGALLKYLYSYDYQNRLDEINVFLFDKNVWTYKYEYLVDDSSISKEYIYSIDDTGKRQPYYETFYSYDELSRINKLRVVTKEQGYLDEIRLEKGESDKKDILFLYEGEDNSPKTIYTRSVLPDGVESSFEIGVNVNYKARINNPFCNLNLISIIPHPMYRMITFCQHISCCFISSYDIQILFDNSYESTTEVEYNYLKFSKGTTYPSKYEIRTREKGKEFRLERTVEVEYY